MCLHHQGSWITGGHVTTVLGWQLLLAGVAAALIAYYGFLSYKSFKGALLWEDSIESLRVHGKNERWILA